MSYRGNRWPGGRGGGGGGGGGGGRGGGGGVSSSGNGAARREYRPYPGRGIGSGIGESNSMERGWVNNRVQDQAQGSRSNAEMGGSRSRQLPGLDQVEINEHLSAEGSSRGQNRTRPYQDSRRQQQMEHDIGSRNREDFMGSTGWQIDQRDVNLTIDRVSASVIAKYGYLDFEEFERELGRRYDVSQLRRNRNESLFNIERVLRNVELVINCAVATNWLITLHDVHRMILESRDFAHVRNFDDLHVGSLLQFRQVEKYFTPPEHIQEHKVIPEISTLEVLQKISEMRTSSGDDIFAKIEQALDEFASSKGLKDRKDLCLYIRKQPLVHFFCNRARRARVEAEKSVKFIHRIKHLEVDNHFSGLQRGVVWWHRLRSLVADLDHANALKCIQQVLQNDSSLAHLFEEEENLGNDGFVFPAFDGQEAHKELCSVCSSYIRGTRWRCATCHDVDLCDLCNEYRVTKAGRNYVGDCEDHLFLPFCEIHGRRPQILYRLVWEIVSEGTGDTSSNSTMSPHRITGLVLLRLQQRHLKLLGESSRVIASACAELASKMDEPEFSVIQYLIDVCEADKSTASKFLDVVQDIRTEILTVWFNTPQLPLSVNPSQEGDLYYNLALLLYMGMYTTGRQESQRQVEFVSRVAVQGRSANELTSLNAGAVLRELEAVVRSFPMQACDVLSALSELDGIVQKHTGSCTQPSLVRLIRENQLLCDYFNQYKHVKAHAVSRADALQTVKSQIESMEDVQVTNVWKVVDELQQLEHNTCKASEVEHFVELSGGQSFLEFCVSSSQLADLIQAKLIMFENDNLSTSVMEIEPAVQSRMMDVAVLLEKVQRDSRSDKSRTSEFLQLHFNCHVGQSFAKKVEFHATRCQDPMPFAFPRSFLDRHCQDPVRADAECTIENLRDEVLRKIESVPPLQDIQEWVDWEDYGGVLGPFPSFIHEQWKQRRVRDVLQVSSDLFVRIERYNFLEFEDSLRHCRARDAAQAAVGQVFLSGSPYAECVARLQKCLTEVLTRGEDARPDAGFILDAIACVPARLRKDVGLPVFAVPFLSSVTHASQLLVSSCKSEAHALVLERLAVAFSHLNLNLRRNQPDQITAQVSVRAQAEERRDDRGQQSSQDGQNELSEVVEESLFASEEQGAEGQTEAICRKIRKKYGIQLDCPELDPELKKVLLEQRRMLKNSLKLLSTELYAKEIHYIHEIIQNCDDNSYAGDQVPTLIIRLKEGLIEFDNNEVGFSEGDVESICSIGQSSKANRKGFIGHKGIGFKSVFKICSRPQIHSNHFHFELSAEATEEEESEGMEYIVPRPVAPPAGWRAGAGTKIVLPIPSSRRQEIQSCIKELDATILLFLRKLRVVEIQDARAEDGSVSIRRMSRQTREEESFRLVNLAEVIDDKESSEDWLVLKTHVAESLQDVCLQLAVPFMHEMASEQGYKQRDVFAYLPVRSYGFRFIVNGDFVVTSSRESIDSMDSKNLCLRDGIAKHFPSLIRELQARYLSATKQEQEQERDVHIEKYTRLVMSVLPTPGEVNDFFAAVPDQMRRSMDDLRLVPLRTGAFVSARHAIWRPRKVESEIIDLLQDLLSREGLGFVHDAMSKYKVLGEHLGIRRLRQVVPCVLKHLEHLLQTRSLDDQLLECLAWTFNELRGEGDAETLQEAYQRRLIPLASGVLVRPREENVYVVQDVSDLLLDPSPCFRILHPLFAEKIGRYGGLTSFWKELKVIWNNSEAFLRDQLIPVLQDERTEAEDLISGLTLVKKLLEKKNEQGRRNTLLELRRQGIMLLDEEGNHIRTCDPLHQGPSYSRHAAMALELVESVLGPRPAVPWRRVSSRYLEKDEDAAGWRGILLGLGVLTFCHVQEPGYTSEETCRLYQTIMDAGDALESRHRRLQRFFALLSDLWQEEYEQALGLPEDRDIGFLRFLQQAKLPATDNHLHPPHLLLHKSEEVFRVLGSKGVYPDIDNLDMKLSQRLGIPSQLKASNVMEQLEHWKTSSTPLSLSFMESVYKCLRSDEGRSRDRQRKFVFLPNKHAVMKLVMRQSKHKYELDPSVETGGKWYSVTSLVQKDPSYLLDSDRADATPRMNDYCCQGEYRSIEVYYRSLIDLFSALGVHKEPPYEFYVNLLRRLEHESSDRVVSAAEQLACKLRVVVHFSFEFDDARNNLRALYSHLPGLKSLSLEDLLPLVRDSKDRNKWIENVLKLDDVVRQIRDADFCFPSSSGSSVALGRCLGIFDEDAAAEKLQTLCDKIGYNLKELQASQRWVNIIEQTVCLQLDGISDGKADQSKVAVKGYPSHLNRFYHDILGLPYLADCIQEEVKAEDEVASITFTLPAADASPGPRDTRLTFVSLSVGSSSEDAGGAAEGAISDPDIKALCPVLESIKSFAVRSSYSVRVTCVRDLYVRIGVRARVDDFHELLMVERRIARQRVGDQFVLTLLKGSCGNMESDEIVEELVRCFKELLQDEDVTMHQIQEAVRGSLSRDPGGFKRKHAGREIGITAALQGMQLEEEPELEIVEDAGRFSEVSKLISENRIAEIERRRQEAGNSGSSEAAGPPVQISHDPLATSSMPSSFEQASPGDRRARGSHYFMMPAMEEEEEEEEEAEAYELANIAVPVDVDPERMAETGRMGEEIMNGWLKARNFDSKWVNEDSESHLPYDFVVRTEGRSWYLEVKATEHGMPESEEEDVYMSPQEIRFALENPVALVRIYQTRSRSPRVIVHKKFSTLVRKDKIDCRVRIRSRAIKLEAGEAEASDESEIGRSLTV